jgi:hypothetical protein
MSKKPEYIPGVCNIGTAEIRKRMLAGWLGLALTAAFGLAGWLLRLPSAWRLLVFFPAAMSALGFLQARMHFCAAFGILGVFQLGSKDGPTDTVEQAEYRRKDRRKAIQIVLFSFLIGTAAAVTAFLL